MIPVAHHGRETRPDVRAPLQPVLVWSRTLTHGNRSSLEALETFIEAQRQLLARVQSDIERLRTLRGEALAEPERFVLNLGHEVSMPCWFFVCSIDPLPPLATVGSQVVSIE